jgi:hypothetical protein
MKTLVGSIRVSLSELAASVYAYGQYLKANFNPADLTEPGEDEETASGDFRLQVTDSGWQTHEGDSQFDQDHRGHWGACSVPMGCTRKEAMDIARSLISEAQESVAMSE